MTGFAHKRLVDAVEQLQRKIVADVFDLGFFLGSDPVRVNPTERRVLGLARAAQGMFEAEPRIDAPHVLQVGQRVSKFAVLGAAGRSGWPGPAGPIGPTLAPGPTGPWVAVTPIRPDLFAARRRRRLFASSHTATMSSSTPPAAIPPNTSSFWRSRGRMGNAGTSASPPPKFPPAAAFPARV